MTFPLEFRAWTLNMPALVDIPSGGAPRQRAGFFHRQCGLPLRGRPALEEANARTRRANAFRIEVFVSWCSSLAVRL